MYVVDCDYACTSKSIFLISLMHYFRFAKELQKDLSIITTWLFFRTIKGWITIPAFYSKVWSLEGDKYEGIDTCSWSFSFQIALLACFIATLSLDTEIL